MRRFLSASAQVTPAVSDSTLTAGFKGLSPAQVLHAYGFDTLASGIGAAVGGSGAGQTIAIVEAFNDPTIGRDLHSFDLQFKLSDPPSLIQLNQSGGSQLPAGNGVWSGETALDVEWVHAVAPDANVVIVQANTDTLGDLLAAVDTARNLADVSVVSMSWGVDEFPAETSLDSLFTTPAGHQSITFVASSGDTTSASGVQWPASSPNVVSVGGTTLVTTASGTATAEVPFPGAVHGTSIFEAPPAYQATNPPASGRNTPDVVYNANPDPGFAVYDSGHGGWETVGGTSAVRRNGPPWWQWPIRFAPAPAMQRSMARRRPCHSFINTTTARLIQPRPCRRRHPVRRRRPSQAEP